MPTLLQELALGDAARSFAQGAKAGFQGNRSVLGAKPTFKRGFAKGEEKARYSIKDKFAAMRDKYKQNRNDRFQSKIAARSDAAEEDIRRGRNKAPQEKRLPGEAPPRPTGDRHSAARGVVHDQAKARAEQEKARQAAIDKPGTQGGRAEGSKEAYLQQRAEQRSNPTGSPTTKLIPLAQADEAKVRQNLQRLSPQHAQELAQFLMSLDVATESYVGTLTDHLLVEEDNNATRQQMASEKSLTILKKWAKQLSLHPGKYGTLMALVSEVLDFPDEQSRQEFRKKTENKFGRYISAAKDKPVQRNTKKAVAQRGREAGDNPQFRTRDEARTFVKDQNQHRRTRRVKDQKVNPGGQRWAAPRV